MRTLRADGIDERPGHEDLALPDIDDETGDRREPLVRHLARGRVQDLKARDEVFELGNALVSRVLDWTSEHLRQVEKRHTPL